MTTSSKDYLSYRKYEREKEKLKGIHLLIFNQLSLILKYSTISKCTSKQMGRWANKTFLISLSMGDRIIHKWHLTFTINILLLWFLAEFRTSGSTWGFLNPLAEQSVTDSSSSHLSIQLPLMHPNHSVKELCSHKHVLHLSHRNLCALGEVEHAPKWETDICTFLFSHWCKNSIFNGKLDSAACSGMERIKAKQHFSVKVP